MATFRRADRFGNPTALVGCKNNKKGYPVGYLEINNCLYKLEPSQSNKDGVAEWIKVTRMKKRSNGGNWSNW